MSKKIDIIIVGTGNIGKSVFSAVDDIRKLDIDTQMMVISELSAKDREFVIKAPPKLPNVEPIIIQKHAHVYGAPSSRAARRKAERDAKKKKKRFKTPHP